MNAAGKLPAVIARGIARGEVSRGNVWGRLQFSNYIRAASDLECNGFTFDYGHLRAFDLKPFQRMPARLHRVMTAAVELRPDQKMVLYLWRHNAGRTPVYYGATLTDESGAILARHVSGARYAQAAAIVAELERAAGLSGGEA